MEIEEYLRSIGINYEGIRKNKTYIIDLLDSDDYGKVYSILDKSEDLEELQDNQVITEQGGSIKYESKSEPYILDLISDWDGSKYQLVVIIED